MTKDEVEDMLRKQWGKGYRVKVKEIIKKTGWKAMIVFYKVTCIRDGMTEYRVKGWGTASAGWDCATRRKW